MDKAASAKLNFIKFILSLFVVCGHAATFTKLNMPTNVLEWISKKVFYAFDPMMNIALAFFFIASAFLLFSTLNGENWREKVIKRVKSLLIPYLIWQGIGVFINFDPVGMSVFLYNLITSSYYGVLWFMEFLFLYALISPIIKLIVIDKRIGLLMILAIAIIQLSGIVDFRHFDFLSDGFARYLNRSFSYFYAYLLGAYLGVHFFTKVLQSNYSRKLRSIAAILFFLIVFFSGNFAWVSGYLLALCPLLIWIFVSKDWFRGKNSWVVETSFWIYAIHPLALSAVRRVVMALQLLNEQIVLMQVNPVYAILWRITMTVSTILISILSGYIMIRFFPKIYQILTGGRIPLNKLTNTTLRTK